MFKAEQMVKVSIVGPKGVLKEVVEELYKLKLLHIREQQKQDDFDIGKTFDNSSQVSELLVKVRTVSAALGAKQQSTGKKWSMKAIEQLTNILFQKVTMELDDKQYTEKLLDLYKQKSQLEILKHLSLNMTDYGDYSSLVYFIGFVKKDFKAELPKLTQRYHLAEAEFEGQQLIALFMDKEKASECQDLLNKFSFIPLDITGLKDAFKGKAVQPGMALKKVSEEVKSLQRRKAAIGENLAKLKEEWTEFLSFACGRLTEESQKAEAPLKFLTSKNAFVITGWLPKKKLDFLRERLNAVSVSKIHIQLEKPGEHEKIPVKLLNPKMVEPFHAFLDLYSYPQYEEFDPSFLMFLTFPLFFGFMLGDIGYGIITLGLFLMLKKKMGGGAGIIDALVLSAVTTIIFGFIFGEFFGAEALLGHELPRLISRTHDSYTVLMISIIIGIVHVNIGLVIGFINELHHGLKHAILHKGSWFVIEVSAALLALGMMKMAPTTAIGGVLFAVACVMLLMGEGISGIVELPSLLSNILSYARLMAVGLASVYLAIVINEYAAEMFHSGIIGAIFGVLLLVGGHLINLVLGIMSPFIHSLRLHYVEFFGKFYKGGGQKYKPFGQ